MHRVSGETDKPVKTVGAATVPAYAPERHRSIDHMIRVSGSSSENHDAPSTKTRCWTSPILFGYHASIRRGQPIRSNDVVRKRSLQPKYVFRSFRACLFAATVSNSSGLSIPSAGASAVMIAPTDRMSEQMNDLPCALLHPFTHPPPIVAFDSAYHRSTAHGKIARDRWPIL